MTAAGKRLDRAVRWAHEVQRVRRSVEAAHADMRALEADVRRELHDARAAVLEEERRAQTPAGVSA